LPMRTSRSVRLILPNAEAFLFAALLSVALFLSGTTARAVDEPAQDPTDVEEPAQIAPDDAEAPSSEAPVPEQPSAEVPPSGTPADGAGGPRVLDRSLFRPDLKPDSEGVTPPPSGQQGNVGGPPDAISLPNPADRSKVLGELYAQLSKAKDAEAAAPITTNIEALWRFSGSPTVDLLISRAERFTTEADLGLALEILDSTVALAPEDAEVWYLRARVHYLRAEYDLALADLKQALDHDPQHYKALEDLGRVYEALGSKQEALDAYRKALQSNPFLQDANQGVQFLSREVGARNL
jgi:tetratricopeptide (TPR) repeat protein